MPKTRPTQPRVHPIAEASPEVAEILSKTMSGVSGKPINIVGTLAHHPKMLKRFNVLGGFFLTAGLLPARERELVILRVGHNCASVYEFGQHTLIGRRVGVTDAEIVGLTNIPESHPWSSKDLALLALADDLCADDCVSDATWSRLRPDWTDAEMLELVMVAGMYRMVSGFLKASGSSVTRVYRTGQPRRPSRERPRARG